MGGIRHVQHENAGGVARTAEEDLEGEQRPAVVEAALVAGGVDVAVHTEPGIAAVPADELEIARVALGGAAVLVVGRGHPTLFGGLRIRSGAALGLGRRARVDVRARGACDPDDAAGRAEQHSGGQDPHGLCASHGHSTRRRRRTPSNPMPAMSAAPARATGSDAPVTASCASTAAGDPGCAGAVPLTLTPWTATG